MSDFHSNLKTTLGLLANGTIKNVGVTSSPQCGTLTMVKEMALATGANVMVVDLSEVMVSDEQLALFKRNMVLQAELFKGGARILILDGMAMLGKSTLPAEIYYPLLSALIDAGGIVLYGPADTKNYHHAILNRLVTVSDAI